MVDGRGVDERSPGANRRPQGSDWEIISLTPRFSGVAWRGCGWPIASADSSPRTLTAAHKTAEAVPTALLRAATQLKQGVNRRGHTHTKLKLGVNETVHSTENSEEAIYLQLSPCVSCSNKCT